MPDKLRTRWSRWPLFIIIFIIQFLLTLYLSSVLLFLLFGTHPRHANIFSILAAINTAPSGSHLLLVVTSIVIAVVVCVGIPWSLYRKYMRRQLAMHAHGKAAFASKGEIKAANFFAQKGIILGAVKGELLRFPGNEFVLLAAPTRSGKGVGFCIPNLLSFDQSVVVLDIKGENYSISAAVRHHHLGQQIYCFNPYSEFTHRWNPFDYVSRNPVYSYTDLMLMASIIYPDRVGEKDPFWKESSRNLFTGLGLLVLETPELPQSIGEVLRQSSGKGLPVKAYLEHIMAARLNSGNPLSANCKDSINRFLNTGEQTMMNILAAFVAPLSIFSSPIVDKATSFSDFDLRDVRRAKQSIYITVPPNQLGPAAFLLNLFFSQLINENIKVLPASDPSLQHQCLIMLDEFTAIGKMDILAKGVGFIAGYNLRLAIIIQDKAQLESVYGKEDAHNLVTNMGVVIYFTPAQVSEAENISKIIGNLTVEGINSSYSNITAINLLPNKSDSFQRQAKPLMSAQELLQMSREKELLVRSGMPVIFADKIYYYKDKKFLKLLSQCRGGSLPTPESKWGSYSSLIQNSYYYLQPQFLINTPDVTKEAISPVIPSE